MKYNLTLDEKLMLLTGKNDWETNDCNGKLQPVFMADGPHGLRKLDKNYVTNKNTSYPNLSMLGCSWDRDLIKLMSSSIADDCIENDVDILLAPGVNMKRSPLCGRNFEYISEDPYLSGELAKNYISGLQEKHIGTSLKHYAANNNETYRFYQNEEIDDRALFDLYLKVFKIALEAKPYTVMCSYNLLNGVYASENKKLLNDILRDKFGFKGVIVSDWGAVKNRAKSLKATLDIAMPFYNMSFEELKQAYDCGFITISEIDESVKRIIDLVEKVLVDRTKRKVNTTSKERHNRAVEIEKECIVLLKNENNILPLSKKQSIDIYNDYQSLNYAGGGSSYVETNVIVKSLFSVLQDNKIKVEKHFVFDSDAINETKIICVGDSKEVESESWDRRNIMLSRRDEETIINIANDNKNTIVILYTGSSIDCSNWIDKVQGVIYAGYGGEGVNEALFDIIFGKCCPCGKMSESFGKTLEDSAVNLNCEIKPYAFYKERFDIGYRFFDKYPNKIQFPFGYGLSYATFSYSNLRIEKIGELDYEISYDIKNDSKIDAKEISQIYIQDVVTSSEKPIKELKAFSKDLIKAGETKKIKIKIGREVFESYNWSINDYYIENGEYRIMVCSSSQKLELIDSINLCLDFYSQYSNKHM